MDTMSCHKLVGPHSVESKGEAEAEQAEIGGAYSESTFSVYF